MKIPSVFRFPRGTSKRTLAAATSLCIIPAVLLGVRMRARSSAPSAAIAAKVDPALLRFRSSSNARTRVILQYTPRTSPEAVREMIRRSGGVVTRDLAVVGGVAATVPASAIETLARDASVRRLTWDGPVYKTDAFTVDHSLANVACAPIWAGGSGVNGQGVAVAVIDSGIVPSADLNNGANLLTGLLSSRLIASVTFLSGQGIGSVVATTLSADPLGHGTHVAGIIAGNGAASTGIDCFQTFYGIAQEANLVSVRVLNSAGVGNISDVIGGIGWVIQNRSAYNIRVINLSLGHPVTQSYTVDPLNQAVEQAWQSGIVVVCSAGNNGRLQNVQSAALNNSGYGTTYGTILCPGNDPDVITVGAMKNVDGFRPDDQIASYSSRGPTLADLIVKPDIVAPGNRVTSLCSAGSTLDTEYGGTNDILWSAYRYLPPALGSSVQYYLLSGTSMSTPVIAGAAALMLQKDPGLSPDTVKARLMFAADKWSFPGGTTDPFTFGAGYINIPAALSSTIVVPSGVIAASPRLVVASNGYLYIDPNHLVWGNGSIWGTGVTDDRAIWGNNAISGSGTVDDQRALWGNASQVQDDRALWGNNVPAADLSAPAIYGEQ